jgi:hypothetical protein
VVNRHYARLASLFTDGDRAAVERLHDEGFARVVVVRTDDEIARLEIVRGPVVSRR